MKQSLLDISDLDSNDLEEILSLSTLDHYPKVLANKGVALVFEKPSARTRNSSEMAVVQLGGHPVTIRADEVGLSSARETPHDLAMTLSCYHSIIGARVFGHDVLLEMRAALEASERRVPLVNLLSDVSHPCQAICDVLTIRQFATTTSETRIAYVGDCNNVCRSLVQACGLIGINVNISSPATFKFPQAELSSFTGAKWIEDPYQAVKGCHFIYSDVWTSMGQESQSQEREKAFENYKVDNKLMDATGEDTYFMHCLPAHRGLEVAAEVMDSERSIVWFQAENRMHAMRGILLYLMGWSRSKILSEYERVSPDGPR